jgi:CubicO group peptidase (beta-lactamase class C family)
LGISGALLPEVASPSDLARAHDDLSKYGFGSGFGDLRTGPLAVFLHKDPRISWVGAGIVSTPENIARWGYELFSPSGSAIPQAARTKLIDSFKIDITGLELSDIGVTTYGYYAGIAEVALSNGSQLKTYTHPGGGGGRTSWLYYSPSLDVSVSLLANSQLLHDPASCGYRGANYMTIGECIAGGIFSTLSGLSVNRSGGY